MRWPLVAVLGLLAPLVAGQLGGPGDPVRGLRLEPSPIVWLDAGAFVMGAGEADIAYAVELCMAERPLPIESLGPSSDGACSERRFLAEAPRRWEWTGAYGIDREEVTNAAWRACVTVGRCPPSRIGDASPLAGPRMPVTGITFAEASAYCAFAGGRLPTEVEWERAARGRRSDRFPWGRQYNPSVANHGVSPEGMDGSDGFATAAPVGSFPAGASAYGLLDVAGNAWEWTTSAPRAEDVGPGSDRSVYRVIRGGSWMQPAEAMRVTHRVWIGAHEQRSDLGFRCAYDRPR